MTYIHNTYTIHYNTIHVLYMYCIQCICICNLKFYICYVYNAVHFHVFNTWPSHSSKNNWGWNFGVDFWKICLFAQYTWEKKFVYFAVYEEELSLAWSNRILNWFLIASLLHNYRVQWEASRPNYNYHKYNFQLGVSRPSSSNKCMPHNFLLCLLQIFIHEKFFFQNKI